VPYAPLSAAAAHRQRALARRYRAPRPAPPAAALPARQLGRNLELLKPLDAIAAAHGATKAQIALAWLLAQGEDSVPIPGTKQQKWLEQNVAAVSLSLNEHELETLADTFKPGARAGERYTPGYFTTLGA
jgi:aryl-alcohol dehydrogenase-like predicted oxidoreductase